MRQSLFVASLVLFSCTQISAPQHQPPELRFTPAGRAERVILLSFDGLGADALAHQADLPAFEQLARDGGSARVIPVNPSVTSSTHVAILTGADPQRTGIVSNRFHLRGTPDRAAVRGMETEIEVETLVEAARRQGKRVGSVSFPTVDHATPARSADFGFAWTQPLTKGQIVRLTRDDFRSEWVPPTWTTRPSRRPSFSPVMRARIEWFVSNGLRTDVDILAYDTTDDRVENYDTYAIELGTREIPIDPRGWFSVSRQAGTGLHGSWSKLLYATPSLDVTLYWGPIHRTHAWPREFQTRLDEAAGFWPGAPDEEAEIDRETFLEQMERLASFYTAAQTFALSRMEFDLLLLYQPQIDEAAHAFLGSPEGERPIRRAWEMSDRAVAAIVPLLDPRRDALIVTGDHGLVSSEREIRMNRLLADHGYGERWKAFTSGSVAHLYRFAGPDDSATLLDLLRRTDYFERVEGRSGSHHRNSGDIIAFALPSVALSESAEPPVVATPARPGQHGGLNRHRELHAALLTWGAGAPRGVLGEIGQTQIARFVAGLLGIDPPAAAE
jgi:hypothetical protein